MFSYILMSAIFLATKPAHALLEETDNSNTLIQDDIIDLRHRIVAMETTVTLLQQQLQAKDATVVTLEKELSNLRQQMNGESHSV